MSTVIETTPVFVPFQKIGRLSRDVIVTEKLDGTNASVTITEDGQFLTASRNRWITPQDDNFGFSRWAHENRALLEALGVGTHFGEWWGAGVGRRYDMKVKKWSLFNVGRWGEQRPACCDVVPTLYTGDFDTNNIMAAFESLRTNGSVAAPGFMRPEGIVIYHTQANVLFKKTFEHDDKGKGFGG